MSFLIPIMFLRIIISLFLKIIISLTGNGGNSNAVKAYKKVTKDLYFNVFITMGIEAIFSYLIAGYLNLKTIEYTSFGEILGVALSYFCLSF